MSLTAVEPIEAPADVPEGVAQVLMSATVFLQWVNEHPELEIVDWGKLEPWSGLIYTPIIKRVEK
jgi:hypothetical protein